MGRHANSAGGRTPVAARRIRNEERTVTVHGHEHQHPDVTDEEIGMRTFQIRKARAVERAMERMRQGLKSEWSSAHAWARSRRSGWVLGEMWAYVARAEWEDLHFSKLTIIRRPQHPRCTRARSRNHTRGSVDVLHDVDALVRSKG